MNSWRQKPEPPCSQLASAQVRFGAGPGGAGMEVRPGPQPVGIVTIPGPLCL